MRRHPLPAGMPSSAKPRSNLARLVSRADQAEIGEVAPLQDGAAQREVEAVAVGQHEAGAAGRGRLDQGQRPVGDDDLDARRRRLGELVGAAVDPAQAQRQTAPGPAPARGRHDRHRTAAPAGRLAEPPPRQPQARPARRRPARRRRTVTWPPQHWPTAGPSGSSSRPHGLPLGQQLARPRHRLPIRAGRRRSCRGRRSAVTSIAAPASRGVLPLATATSTSTTGIAGSQQVAQTRRPAPGSCRHARARRSIASSTRSGVAGAVEPRAEAVVRNAGDGVGDRVQHRDRPASAAARPPPWSGRSRPRGSAPSRAGRR